MKNRSAMFTGLALLILALGAVGAAFLGPRSDKLNASRPDLGNDPGIRATTTVSAVPAPNGGPTTIGGVGPTFVTTTAPFELAEPQDSNTNTTIPGPGPSFFVPSHGPTTTTQPIASTTTTTMPIRPHLPPPASITSLCGMLDVVGSIESIFTNPSLNARAEVSQLLVDMGRYLVVSPPQLLGDVQAINQMMLDALAALNASNGDVHSPGLTAIFNEVQQHSGSYTEIAVHINRIQFYQQVACPNP